MVSKPRHLKIVKVEDAWVVNIGNLVVGDVERKDKGFSFTPNHRIKDQVNPVHARTMAAVRAFLEKEIDKTLYLRILDLAYAQGYKG